MALTKLMEYPRMVHYHVKHQLTIWIDAFHHEGETTYTYSIEPKDTSKKMVLGRGFSSPDLAHEAAKQEPVWKRF